jgi:hypothetical protein
MSVLNFSWANYHTGCMLGDIVRSKSEVFFWGGKLSEYFLCCKRWYRLTLTRLGWAFLQSVM